MDMVAHKEKLKKMLEDQCKELEDKNNKMTKQFSCKASLQGEKHLSWDVIISKIAKLQI